MIRHLHSKNMTGDKRSRYEGNVATITIRHVLGSREAAITKQNGPYTRAHRAPIARSTSSAPKCA